MECFFPKLPLTQAMNDLFKMLIIFSIFYFSQEMNEHFKRSLILNVLHVNEFLGCLVFSKLPFHFCSTSSRSSTLWTAPRVTRRASGSPWLARVTSTSMASAMIVPKESRIWSLELHMMDLTIEEPSTSIWDMKMEY